MPEFRGSASTSVQKAFIEHSANTLLKELHDARLKRHKAETPATVLAQEASSGALSPKYVDAYFVRPLLVLDLDGTLLDTQKPGVRPGCPPSFLVKFWSDDVQETRLRPGLAHFLRALRPHFDFAVFTAADDAYAQCMIRGIDAAVSGFRSSLRAVFSAKQVQFAHKGGHMSTTKDLRKLAEFCGVPLCRTLIVDDNPETYRLNQSNALPVPAYVGMPTDEVLNHLCAFLVKLPSHGVPLDISAWAFAPSGSSALLVERVDGLLLDPSRPSALEDERAWGAFLPPTDEVSAWARPPDSDM
eukprot:4002993-Prymnesium_polylepis.1